MLTDIHIPMCLLLVIVGEGVSRIDNLSISCSCLVCRRTRFSLVSRFCRRNSFFLSLKIALSFSCLICRRSSFFVVGAHVTLEQIFVLTRATIVSWQRRLVQHDVAVASLANVSVGILRDRAVLGSSECCVYCGV